MIRDTIKKILRESDGLEWIRDTNPGSYDFLIGKALHFQPNINNDDDKERIINYLTSLGFNGYGPLAGGYFNWDEYGGIEGLYLTSETTIVWTPNLDGDNENYQQHINTYARKNVEVLDGWGILSNINPLL